MELKGDVTTVTGGSARDLKGSDSNSQKPAAPVNSSSTMSTGEGQRAQKGLESAVINQNQSNNLENRMGGIESDEGDIHNVGTIERDANSDESISNRALEEGNKKNHSKGKVGPDRSSGKGGNDRSRGKTTADTVTTSATGKPVVVDSIENPVQQSNENIISSDTHNKGKDAKVESQKGAVVGNKHKNVNHDSQAKSKRIENSSNTNKATSSKWRGQAKWVEIVHRAIVAKVQRMVR